MRGPLRPYDNGIDLRVYKTRVSPRVTAHRKHITARRPSSRPHHYLVALVANELDAATTVIGSTTLTRCVIAAQTQDGVVARSASNSQRVSGGVNDTPVQVNESYLD